MALVNALCLYAEFGVASVPNSVIFFSSASLASYVEEKFTKFRCFFVHPGFGALVGVLNLD